MRKIAFVIGGLPFGGVENWLFDIALRMKRGGAYACRIFNVSGTGVKMPEFEAASLDVVCIGNSNAAASTHRLDTALRLRRELKRYDPDIIHTLHFGGDYFGRIAAMGLGVPVITHLRNVKREKKPVRRIANKLLSFWTDAYISVSRAVEQVVESDHNMFKRRQYILYNALDTERLNCAPYDLKSMFGLQGNILIGIGRYVEQKNFENLIQSVKILISSGRNVSLILIGEGDRRKNYEIMIDELKLKDRIILTGYRDDVAAFLRGSDVLVMPSLYEGFLNVHIEAMYCGVPSVLSHTVPSLEIFSKAAVICDFFPESIAHSIDLLIGNPEKYAEIVKIGRLIAEEHTLDYYIKLLFDIYDDILNNN